MQGALHRRHLTLFSRRSITCGKRLTTLDISLPSVDPEEHAGENVWDADVAKLLLQLPVLQHFAACNTLAGVLPSRLSADGQLSVVQRQCWGLGSVPCPWHTTQRTDKPVDAQVQSALLH